MDDFAEVLTAASGLVSLSDAARAEAWMSSALSLWREEDNPAQIDMQFVAWLEKQPASPDALAVALAGSQLAGSNFRTSMAALAQQLHDGGVASPLWATAVGTAQPTQAWHVVDGDDTSIGLGFVHTDQGEHSLLADISGGVLGSLIVGPPPDEFLELVGEDVTAQTIEIEDATQQIYAAWLAFLEQDSPLVSEAYVVNHLVAECRLRPLLEPGQSESLAVVPAAPDAEEQVLSEDAEERAELNQWASDVLQRALPAGAEQGTLDESNEMVAAVLGLGGTRQEREAFQLLEWADWLGSVIGLVRGGPDQLVDGRALVDHVNRCPEVTSSIPKADRPRMEGAFDLVVALWLDAGALDDRGHTTAPGLASIRQSLLTAWELPVQQAGPPTNTQLDLGFAE